MQNFFFDIGAVAVKVIARSKYDDSRYHKEDGSEEKQLLKRSVITVATNEGIHPLGPEVDQVDKRPSDDIQSEDGHEITQGEPCRVERVAVVKALEELGTW